MYLYIAYLHALCTYEL